MKFYRYRWREIVLGILILANVFVWISIYQRRPSEFLHVYFLDVGQGDSIFIDSPTHKHILLDGGPNSKVLSEIGRILPFGERDIDVVIESHPDADHIGGLVDVLHQYKTGVFIEPGVKSTNKVDNMLHSIIKQQNIPDVLARKGMVVDLGDGVKLNILFPNQDVTNWKTNDASIVAKLVYGDKSFLLTGDSPKKSEYILLSLDKEALKSDVLKVGHHGSKYSTSLVYAQTIAPEYAVISAGAHNTYGHPTKEVLSILKQVGANVVSTESVGGLTGMGTIEFETDGESLRLK